MKQEKYITKDESKKLPLLCKPLLNGDEAIRHIEQVQKPVLRLKVERDIPKPKDELVALILPCFVCSHSEKITLPDTHVYTCHMYIHVSIIVKIHSHCVVKNAII